jgi:hypothetical protein
MTLHLSFQEEGNMPLAVIRGGRYDSEVVFISEKPDKPARGKLAIENEVDYTPYLKAYKPRERAVISARLNKAFRFERPPEDDIVDIYNSVKSATENQRSLSLMDGGTCQVLPDPEKRSIVYVFGASGSGKSYFVKGYVQEWKKLHPKAPVYVFSRLEKDESLDEIKPKRVLIDDSLADERITTDDFEPNSMVIFDDIDTLPKNQLDAVYSIMNDILQVGRHRNIYCCITSHLGSDYKKTRVILNEAHGICIFPNGSSAKQITYVLETYAGLDKADIKKLRKLPSRWVFVRKAYPAAVVYNTGCYLLTGGE